MIDEKQEILETNRLYPTIVVANYLGITQAAVRRLINKKVIMARTNGKRYYLTGTEVHRYISRLRLIGRKNGI